jgi:hypothetical protein
MSVCLFVCLAKRYNLVIHFKLTIEMGIGTPNKCKPKPSCEPKKSSIGTVLTKSQWQDHMRQSSTILLRNSTISHLKDLSDDLRFGDNKTYDDLIVILIKSYRKKKGLDDVWPSTVAAAAAAEVTDSGFSKKWLEVHG